MRAYLLCLLSCISLAGCAYQGGIHTYSRPYSAETLSQHHTQPNSQEKPILTKSGKYQSITPVYPIYAKWWDRFHNQELDQLIQTALNNSPNMHIAEARVRQAQYMADEVASSLYPSVDLDGNLQRQKFSKTGLIPPPFNGKIFTIGTLGLNFNYDLDFWGKNRQMLQASLSDAYARRVEQAQAELIISASVANAYIQLCGDIQQVKIASETWRVNQEILKIANQRAKHGINSEIPVKTIQANIQAAKQLLEHYRQAETLSRNQLAVLMGDNPFTTTIQNRPFTYHNYHITLPSQLPARLLAQRPDIIAARARTEAAASRINVAKARFFPDINLSAFFNYQSVYLGNFFASPNQNYGVTGAIDLPIFDAGLRRADLGAKSAEYDEAVSSYNQTILSALREVADLQATIREVNSDLASQNTAVSALQRNYALSRSRFHHGVDDYSQKLQSQQALLQQESQLVALRVRHTQAVVATLIALGGNDDANIRA